LIKAQIQKIPKNTTTQSGKKADHVYCNNRSDLDGQRPLEDIWRNRNSSLNNCRGSEVSSLQRALISQRTTLIIPTQSGKHDAFGGDKSQFRGISTKNAGNEIRAFIRDPVFGRIEAGWDDEAFGAARMLNAFKNCGAMVHT